METMTNNKKKSFLNKFLLATSSIGMLASMESFAADLAPRGQYITTYGNLGWRTNGGNQNAPANNDNIILTENGQVIDFNNNIAIGNINLYGYNNAEFRISDSDPTRRVSIGNIINNNIAQAAIQQAMGMPHAYGGNNGAKVNIVLHSNHGTTSELTITGNDISAVNSIRMLRGGCNLIFQGAVTVNAEIYSSLPARGVVEVKNDVIFKKTIGQDQNHAIYLLRIADNKSATLESDIYATDISLLGPNTKLIINPSAQNINIYTSIANNSQGDMDDGYGKIQVKGDVNNTVTFHRDIGEKTEINNGRYTDTVRIGEIDIETGKKTEFKQIVTAKKIKVAVNDVAFEDKLDMKQYNNNIVIGVGNLEFIDHGKVKFDKDFIGDIITSKANQGEATFVNTPDIFGIGAVNRRIKTVIFTGNHNHNLHKDIHAEYIKFDAGTYNINNGNVLIDGTAHFNGSTLNLVHNLTFTGDVESVIYFV